MLINTYYSKDKGSWSITSVLKVWKYNFGKEYFNLYVKT